MLSHYAVERFLSRELDSFNWIKKLSRKELLEEIKKLNPQPRFVGPHEPWTHQLAAFLIGVYFPQFFFMLDLGTGKTRVILDLLSYRKLCGQKLRVLVLVPYTSNIEDWLGDASRYAPSLNCVSVEGSSTERLRALNRSGDIFLLHYAGLVALCTSLVEVQGRGGQKRKRKLDEDKLPLLLKKFAGVVLDESTSIANKSSLTYRVCNQLAKYSNIRFALTGTPFGRDLQALWAQFYFIDRGLSLGQTLSIFREIFFRKKKRYWGGYDYIFMKSRASALRRCLANRSIFYSEDECVDLPPRLSIPKYVRFTPEMQTYYTAAVNQLKAGRNDFRIVKNSFLNMRQIASGFIGLVDDETGERAKIEFPHNPKLEKLEEIIETMPKGSKAVVFHEYVWTGSKIIELLEKNNIGFARLGHGQRDPRGALRKFREDKDCRIFIVNNNSGAFGLNLQVANYTIYVESPVRPIIRRQTEKRVWRAGQRKKTFLIDIIMKGTVDEKILGFLKQGRDLYGAILKGEKVGL